jgi:hypothetical protein
MMWNWQQPDWPDFSSGKSRTDDFEKRLLLGAGLLFGVFKHLNEEDKQQLTIELISNEALKTSEIEGEYLDRDSLQSYIRRQFGLITDNRKISAAEQGIAEVVVDLYRGFEAFLSHTMLFEWYKMLTNGRRDLKDIGRTELTWSRCKSYPAPSMPRKCILKRRHHHKCCRRWIGSLPGLTTRRRREKHRCLHYCAQACPPLFCQHSPLRRWQIPNWAGNCRKSAGSCVNNLTHVRKKCWPECSAKARMALKVA